MNYKTLAALLLLAAPACAGPRVAVVIDDFALTYPKNPQDAEWMAFDAPLTFAVMPDYKITTLTAKRAHEAGKEVIMHYPFDPYQRYDLNPTAATPGDVEKASKLLARMLKQVPGAVGLNNHRSDRATKNRPLMRAFMKLYKPTGLYFIDSKVSSKSVAYSEAKAAGIRTAENFIFLDTAQVHTKPFCEKMLGRAIAHARKYGSVLVIGHHYFHGTLDCLKEEMPRYTKEGIEFVKASALVK
ncbi:MAG: divergent polysaccharide deacetylase family protein [Elusimicrobia bacterium]|nr:divergent polysaccharide deacetylase family protein [Elusimicrobiota bacterium]